MSKDKWMHNTEKIQLGPITNTEPVIYPHNLLPVSSLMHAKWKFNQ